ncbi:MAG TPA: Holliday junction resolvase RuvX [Tepidisphaeraceae bacterium]|nr:Holliday junction resolvase RuvX [Tepidisphaeraceae bacterium]
MRTLAIDLGTRRIGLAMSDEGGQFGTPHDVMTVASSEAAIEPIAKLARAEGVQRLVVGLPLNMDDTPGPAARAAVAWGDRLAAAAGAPVVYVDERLSSFAAEQSLNARRRGGERLTRGKKKQQLDALAAADFLQAFLDHRLPEIDVSDLRAR